MRLNPFAVSQFARIATSVATMINSADVLAPTRLVVVEEWDDERADVVVYEVETDDAGSAELRTREGYGTFRVLADAPPV